MMTAHGHLSHAGPEPVVTFDPGERDLHGATVGRDRTRAGVWARHPFVTEAGENDMKDAKGPFWIAVFVVLTVTLGGGWRRCPPWQGRSPVLCASPFAPPSRSRGRITSSGRAVPRPT